MGTWHARGGSSRRVAAGLVNARGALLAALYEYTSNLFASRPPLDVQACSFCSCPSIWQNFGDWAFWRMASSPPWRRPAAPCGRAICRGSAATPGKCSSTTRPPWPPGRTSSRRRCPSLAEIYSSRAPCVPVPAPARRRSFSAC
eukprot:915296-Prymnesium_polylepis.1